VLVDTPILTPAACEGTTPLFSVPYFDHATAYILLVIFLGINFYFYFQ